jgi:uncharacterized protein YciI
MTTKELTFMNVLRRANSKSMARISLKEEAIVGEHFEYLKETLTGGRLILEGRCLNGEFGIVIFYVDSEKQAEDFMGNYAAVKKGVVTAELYRFNIALKEKA